ncbi:hypothetical protein AWV79_26705 [Cupriavidus sp. UYMMa02A]|nr:hypothetical protein AWV79_26705 [Cupriavidus sp. UYMMa02A]
MDAAVGALRSQLGEKRYERLTAALSLFLGIEAAVVLRDVCFLSPADAREVKVWGAQAILAAALAEASESGKRSKGLKQPVTTKKITPLEVSRKR